MTLELLVFAELVAALALDVVEADPELDPDPEPDPLELLPEDFELLELKLIVVELGLESELEEELSELDVIFDALDELVEFVMLVELPLPPLLASDEALRPKMNGAARGCF